MKLPNVATELASRLVGQTAAIAAIAPAIRMYEAGLNAPDRPIAVFLLAGPTGVGKTRTVEALAEVLHGDAKALIRIDCGEFQYDQEISKLLGAPPGWVGHNETQALITDVKLKGIQSTDAPISLVLFDEIEKCCPALERALLCVFDKGKLGLGTNKTADFTKTIIFLTSNLGGSALSKAAGAGFGLDAYTGRSIRVNPKSLVTSAIQRRFSPEFVNRIDAILPYQPLTASALSAILDQQLLEVRARLALSDRYQAQLEVPPRTKTWLLANGTSAQYGARELKRTLQRELIQPLANWMIERDRPARTVYRAEMNKGGDAIQFREKAGK